MQVWLELIAREAFFLALLVALGVGAASFLPARLPVAARLALVPVIGLCVGACATVTLVYAVSARGAAWVVVAAAAVSVALAVRRTRWALLRPGRWASTQMLLLTVVILGSFNVALASRHTAGPVGGYRIADATGYVSEINGEARQSIHQADRDRPPFSDLALGYWAGYAGGDQQLDISALEASANELLGLGSTDTQTPFLISVVLAAALGAFAVVRATADRGGWAATISGCLFAGPLFVELLIDGSQAAIAGSALMAPLALLSVEALRYRDRATLALVALLAAGLQTVYPLFVPSVVAGAGLALAVLLVRRRRRGPVRGREVGVAAAQLLAVIGIAALFTPVAFSRNAHYWSSILNGSLSLAGLSPYSLRLSVLPGWLLQTREFYGLVPLGHASAGQLAMAGLVPMLMLGVVALAVWRHRTALMMLAIAAGAMLLALYTGIGRNCSYCVQRNLLPIAPLGAAAIGLGIATLPLSRLRAGLPLAVTLSVLALVTVGHEGAVVRQRMTQGAYLLDRQAVQAVGGLRPGAGPVELEGFGQGPKAPMEEPLVYNLVDERTNGHVSVATSVDDRRGLLYLGGPQPLGPSFHPGYRYVLTRLGGISTDRRILARYGPIALEQRAEPDVTITGGVAVAMARRDPVGLAWVDGPLHFLIVGGSDRQPVWLELRFARTAPNGRPHGTAPVTVSSEPGTLRICMAASGHAPLRNVDLEVPFTRRPPPPTAEPYAEPLPARGLRLLSMMVLERPCAVSSRTRHG